MSGQNTFQFDFANFEKSVLQSDLPVLVDIWAPWCGPCRMLAPAIDAVADQFSGRIRVGRLNADENPIIARRYQVHSIPTLLVFRDGAIVDRVVGAVPQDRINAMLTRQLTKI